MPELSFDHDAAKHVLEPFNITIENDADEQYLVYEGSRLTDARNEPITVDEVQSIIHLEAYDLDVDDCGFVIDKDGERISKQFEGGNRHYDAIVPFTAPDGSASGILRGTFPAAVDFANATRHIDR